MRALVLERAGQLALRSIEIAEQVGPRDVRVALHTVGICGSDIHYYKHGRIGPFVVRSPMVLGHEAAGTVLEVGGEVEHLRSGDRVCMEPGIPDPQSRCARLGRYHLDPALRFWATPPVHGCLRPEVVHPAAFTFRLPDRVSMAEAALVEPAAVGLHAAAKARIEPGEKAVVVGAGPIGTLTALAALAAGCSEVILADVQAAKAERAAALGPIVPVDVSAQDLGEVVAERTGNWGADVVFEASGNARAAAAVFDLLRPAGRVVFIGLPQEPVSLDVAAIHVREPRIEHVFRYAHVFPRVLDLMAGGRLPVAGLVTDTYPFARSVEAFDFACALPPTSVKVQIEMEQ